MESQKCEQQQNLCLPDDVMCEILLRLPAQSLLKFKCVCKLFAKVASDPSFVSSHIEYSRVNPSANSIIMKLPNNTGLCVLRGVEKFRDNAAYLMKVQLHKTSFSIHDTIDCHKGPLASCNGLLVFENTKNSFFVGNPLTNNWVSVTIPGFRVVQLLGFYFHSPSSQYRLLVAMRDVMWEPTVYAVFVLGENTLRPINSIPKSPICSRGYDKEMFLSRGRLHWFGGLVEEHCSNGRRWNWMRLVLKSSYNSIVIFDLETEQFSDIPTPLAIDDRYIKFLELDGKICVCHEFSGSKMELWMLEDYEKGIWTQKEVFLEDMSLSDEICEAQTYTPVMCSHHGGSFLLFKSEGNNISSTGRELTLYCLDVSAFLPPKPFSILDDDTMMSSMIYGRNYTESFDKI